MIKINKKMAAEFYHYNDDYNLVTSNQVVSHHVYHQGVILSHRGLYELINNSPQTITNRKISKNTETIL